MGYMSRLQDIAASDVKTLNEKGQAYGDSWKKRGGVGAFMMLARKWDRLENQCRSRGWDVFAAIAKTPGPEGVLDDIRDLRAYLLLVEAEYLHNTVAAAEEGSATSAYVNQDR